LDVGAEKSIYVVIHFLAGHECISLQAVVLEESGEMPETETHQKNLK